jgi:hypothetical protein
MPEPSFKCGGNVLAADCPREQFSASLLVRPSAVLFGLSGLIRAQEGVCSQRSTLCAHLHIARLANTEHWSVAFSLGKSLSTARLGLISRIFSV